MRSFEYLNSYRVTSTFVALIAFDSSPIRVYLGTGQSLKPRRLFNRVNPTAAYGTGHPWGQPPMGQAAYGTGRPWDRPPMGPAVYGTGRL